MFLHKACQDSSLSKRCHSQNSHVWYACMCECPIWLADEIWKNKKAMSEPKKLWRVEKKMEAKHAVNKENLLKVNVNLKELEDSMRTSFESHSKHLFPSTGCGVWQYLHTGQLGNISKQKGYRSCSERSCKDRSRSYIWNLVQIVEAGGTILVIQIVARTLYRDEPFSF